MGKWAKIQADFGIICGADHRQEWLLPWWWERLTAHHDFPVTFCDFGMSEKAKDWCRERGSLVSIANLNALIAEKQKIREELLTSWERCYISSVWEFRSVWFHKPLAFLQSPYKRAIWIDLDCEILRPIHELFSFCSKKSQLGILREFVSQHLPRFHPSIVYNTGVVVFEHGAPIIEKWEESARHLSHVFWGDEVLLSHLIYEEKLEVYELPGRYNWWLAEGIDVNAAIVHFRGEEGKEFIKRFGGVKPSLEKFLFASVL